MAQDGCVGPGGATDRLIQRLQSAETTEPDESGAEASTPPFQAQIDDERQHLEQFTAELEAAERAFADHQKALADAQAELNDARSAAPDAGPPDMPERDKTKERAKLKSASRMAIIEAASIQMQIEVAKRRVKRLEQDKRAESAVGMYRSLRSKSKARLADLLRKQAEASP